MMQHEIQYFHLIAHLELAVQTLYNTITMVAKIQESHFPVWQIGNLNTDAWM